MKSVLCRVKGLVQGVGFRPFVYRTAINLGLKGIVENRTDGVKIVVQGDPGLIEKLAGTIRESPPPASIVESIILTETEAPEYDDFRIVKSEKSAGGVTEVSPDIAVCDDCLEDLKHQKHRIDYPFINCTNCGPRFTIIKALPYDRHKTTMKPFEMCDTCRSEYENPLDRRFHAQPVACNECGPFYTLHQGGRSTGNFAEILKITAKQIDEGGISAIKGLGGFNLVCDALNPKAVKALRMLKLRETKPFALMVKDTAAARKYVRFDQHEKKLLESWMKPIVLLRDGGVLPVEINRGLSETGIMLPYMPFHYQLFEKLKTDCIVATSGNFSDEPIIIDNSEALDKFLSLTDCVITYNREIHNRCDDSVAFSINGKTRLIRRSRGWAPRSIGLTADCNGILAVGGELKNTFCLGRENRAILSQHIGDLKSCETEGFFRESVDRMARLFEVKVDRIIHDLHPDYLSTRYAEESGLTTVAVQHHWAHIASCLAEHGRNEKVIGFAFDGTGYGTDGAIWGGEVLICDFHDFERYTHLDYVPLPGGDRAVKEPWRMGVSWLYRVYGNDFKHLTLPFLEEIEEKELDTVVHMIKRGINSIPTSSMGRLFDAVSAITGTCLHAGFEAEAAMRLESAGNSIGSAGTEDFKSEDHYLYDIDEVIDVSKMIKGVVMDIESGLSVSAISQKFHHTIAKVIVDTAQKVREERGLNTAALSGGVFLNKILLKLTEDRLVDAGFEVLSNIMVPAGDGGIALGQCAIGAKKSKIEF